MNSFNKEYKDGMTPKYREGVLGAPLSIQSANQIQDMAMRLNEGIKNIEISAISPEIAEGIPKEHFQEMRRLSELTDSKVSMHAPIIDASGFTQQGWSEQNRVAAEKQFNAVLKNAYDLDKNGNVPVVFHGANMFGIEYDKSIEEKYKTELKEEYGKLGKQVPEKVPRVLTVVDQMTGQVVPLEFKEKFMLEKEKRDLWIPEKQLESLNSTHWDQEKLKVFSQMKEVMELSARQQMLQKELDPLLKLREKDLLHEHEKRQLSELGHSYSTIQSHINTINSHVNSSIEDMYNTYIRCTKEDKLDDEDKAKFNWEKGNLSEIGKGIKKIDEEWKKNRKELENKSPEEAQRMQSDYINKRNDLITNAISFMNNAPELFVPVNDFAKEKSSDTFSNIAFDAYKKFGDKAPVIAVENSYPNMPLSVAKDLKEAIQLSREKFAKKLIKEENLDPKEAKAVASKLIGATWDVGHINILRKSGYSEAEIIKEAEQIAPYVKHVHLTDNFGLLDAHLPPGMGNVPIKEILQKLEEGGNMEKVRQIVEAGNFVQNFKESPYPYTLESLGSPIYSIGGAPYWNEVQQRSAQMDYSMGFGEMLPDYHFKQFYGGGWSAVPRELGGEAQGSSQRGRFAEGS